MAGREAGLSALLTAVKDVTPAQSQVPMKAPITNSAPTHAHPHPQRTTRTSMTQPLLDGVAPRLCSWHHSL